LLLLLLLKGWVCICDFDDRTLIDVSPSHKTQLMLDKIDRAGPREKTATMGTVLCDMKCVGDWPIGTRLPQ
jgi:hypothetical protein